MNLMARKSGTEYISLYTEGSAARNVVFTQPRKKSRTKLPKARKERSLIIRVDPLALCGIVVACVMMILMTVGCVQLYNAHVRNQQAEQYVLSLQKENSKLQMQYESGYDLDEIRNMALAMGMVPEQNRNRVPIQMELQQPPQELTLWQSVCAFFTGLFA